jgi:hypothetical protein
MDGEPHNDPPRNDRPRYERHSPGLEFDRFVFFSDAVFAIAMTLLVVGIGIPHVAGATSSTRCTTRATRSSASSSASSSSGTTGSPTTASSRSS